jgi:hypothetical protein
VDSPHWRVHGHGDAHEQALARRPGRTTEILFEGPPDLLRLIASLCRRPWSYWRETRLPVIRLIRAPGVPDPLGGIEAFGWDAMQTIEAAAIRLRAQNSDPL